MAVAGRALKRQQSSRSAFGIPLKSAVLSRIPPPQLHCVCCLTGGLSKLYRGIWNPEKHADEQDEAPLLAKRYHFVRFLGKGCSATLIQAVDTFRPNNYSVAIKMLKSEYYALGYQESDNIKRLNCADPHDFSGTVRLLNTFSFDGQFCLVFELLHPKPLHQYFKGIPAGPKKLQLVRRVAVQLLQVLGFLQQENVIHADLKPENILCRTVDLSSGIKVIDFGNAIHCVYDELSLYYDDFELQTLLYRAPEVVYGLPFGPEIDVWSLGCILAELYLGEPLFSALTKEELLQKMVAVLGPLPVQVFQRGKFYFQYEHYVDEPQSMLETQSKLLRRLGGVRDYNFASFLLSILRYNPSERMSLSEAFLHPFLAPEVAAKFLFPSGSKGSTSSYNKVNISPSIYTHSPAVSTDTVTEHLSSLDLLKQGTGSIWPDPVQTKKPKRAVAEVAPFAPKQEDIKSLRNPDVVRVPVKERAPVKNRVSSVGGKLGSEKDRKVSCCDVQNTTSVAQSKIAARVEDGGPLLQNLTKEQGFKQHQEPLALPEHLEEQHRLDSVLQREVSEGSLTVFQEKETTCLPECLQNEGSQTKQLTVDEGSFLLDKDTEARDHSNKRKCHKPEEILETKSEKSGCTGILLGVRSGIHTQRTYQQNTSAKACSPGLSSSDSLKDALCVGSSELGEKNKQLQRHRHRSQVARTNLLAKNPLNTMAQGTGDCVKNEGNFGMWYKETFAKETKSVKEKDNASVTPVRPFRVTKSTPSNGLNLLTPLRNSQVVESPAQQFNNHRKSNHRSTPKRTTRSVAKTRKRKEKLSKTKTKVLAKSIKVHQSGVKKLKMGRPSKRIPNLLRNDGVRERNLGAVSGKTKSCRKLQDGELSSFKDGVDQCRSSNSHSSETSVTSGNDQDNVDRKLKRGFKSEDVYSMSFVGPEKNHDKRKYKGPGTASKDQEGSPSTSNKSIDNSVESKSNLRTSMRKSKRQAQVRIKACGVADVKPYYWLRLNESDARVPDMDNEQITEEDTVEMRLGQVPQTAEDVIPEKRTYSKHSSIECFEVECEDKCKNSRTACQMNREAHESRKGRTLSSSAKKNHARDVVGFEDMHNFEPHQKSTNCFLPLELSHKIVSKQLTAKRDLSKQFLTQGLKSYADSQQKALLHHGGLKKMSKAHPSTQSKTKCNAIPNKKQTTNLHTVDFRSNKSQKEISRTTKVEARGRSLKRKVELSSDEDLGKRERKRKAPQEHKATCRSAPCSAQFDDVKLYSCSERELSPRTSDGIGCQRVPSSEIGIDFLEESRDMTDAKQECTRVRESIKLVHSASPTSDDDDDEVMLLLP